MSTFHRTLARILFCCFLWPLHALAVDNLVGLRVWTPNDSSRLEYPHFLLPARLKDDRYAVVPHYLRQMRVSGPLASFVPQDEWIALAYNYPVVPIHSEPARARVLILANRLDDHQANSIHLKESLPQLMEAGVQPYVLPVGALLRLTSLERITFFKQLGIHFKALILLGGRDLDPASYDEPVTDAEDYNGDLDRENLNIIRGVIKYTDLKIFAICRGAQEVAVAQGCKLHQDVEKDLRSTLPHKGNVIQPVYLIPTKNNLIRAFAEVDLEKPLSSIDLVQNHHQAVNIPSDHPHLQVAAVSPDGLVTKGFESRDGRIVALQSHPERDPHGVGGLILRNFCAQLLRDGKK